MNTATILELPTSFDPEVDLNDLSTDFIARPVRSNHTTHTFYDTFDWRLFQKGMFLFDDGHQLTLLVDDQPQLNQVITGVRPLPSIKPADLQDRALRKRLSPIIARRTLMPKATIDVKTDLYRILNDDEKTVVRMSHKRIQTGEHQVSTVNLSPVRGYTKEFRRFNTHLGSIGAAPVTVTGLIVSYMEANGNRPGAYDAKPSLMLFPTTHANDAIRQLLRNDFEVIRINLPYIEREIDTEFLHEFRIAMRRSRTLLGQLGSVFSPESAERFKGQLREINQATNELRDLDVYLLAESEYRARLQESMRDSIKPLFDYLRKRRKRALKKTVTVLHSTQTETILNDWDAFLLQSPDHDTLAQAPDATRPIIEVARERIYKLFKRILQDGERILITQIDEEMHELRLVCKKLRYLLENFSSLFPKKEIQALIKQLKGLQNNLGRFQDLCVQEVYLLEAGQSLPAKTGADTLIAVGALITTLQEERRKTKADFSDAFLKFRSEETVTRFETLFRTKRSKA